MEKGVIGLYGCYCHPFKDFKEVQFFNNQVVEIGQQYKNRHSGVIGIVQGFCEDNANFVKIFVEPFDCNRCNQTEHKSNLIKITNVQLKLF